MQILGYFELPDEDQPDPSIWNQPEKISEWFDEVKNRRNNPGTERVDPEWENVELDQNELTKGLR